MIRLLYLSVPDGSRPFEDWFSGLDSLAAAKVTTALARIEQGNLSNVKGIGEGVLEFRIDWGPGYRVYFGRDGLAVVILLVGGTKRRQDADIARAKGLWTEYRRSRVRGRRGSGDDDDHA